MFFFCTEEYMYNCDDLNKTLCLNKMFCLSLCTGICIPLGQLLETSYYTISFLPYLIFWYFILALYLIIIRFTDNLLIITILTLL